MVNFDQNESDRRIIQLRMDVDLLKKKNDQLVNKILSLKSGTAITEVVTNPTQSSPVQTAYVGSANPNPMYPLCEVPSGTIDGINKLFSVTKNILAIPKPILELNGAIQDPLNATVDFKFQRNQITYTVAPEVGAHHVIWYWPGSNAGNARYFNSAANDHILWGNNNAWNIGGDLTIAFWIKIPSTSTNSSTIGTIIFYGDASTGGNDSYKIFLQGSSNNWNITANHEDTLSNQDSVTIANGLQNDTWYFIGIVRDSVAKTYTGYVGNGNQLNNGLSGAYTHTPASPGGVNLAVGYQWNSGIGANLSLNANIEEHYIWSRKLNTTDLISAMNGSSINTTNLVLACLMGNTPEIDLSATGGSGAITGTTLIPGHP